MDLRDESSRLCFSFLICPLSPTLSPSGLVPAAFASYNFSSIHKLWCLSFPRISAVFHGRMMLSFSSILPTFFVYSASENHGYVLKPWIEA